MFPSRTYIMANDALKERAVAEILEETKKAAARAEV